VHIEVHVYKLGFVKPCSNEMDEPFWRRILSDLWANLEMAGQVYGDFELMHISLPELQTLDQRPSNILLENLIERFGVGLTSSDIIAVYIEDQVEQSNDEGFAPLVLDLAEKGAAGRESSKKASARTQDPPQDPRQDPAQNPPDDHDLDPPNDPSEDPPDDPTEDLPEPLEKKKVDVVTIYPEQGYVHQGSHVAQQEDPISEACIVPILHFEFELKECHKKITTTLRTQCNLGEEGGFNGSPLNLGYFQDNITISLTCEKAATLLSSKVEDVQVAKGTITNNNSTSLARGAQVNFLGVHLGFKLEQVMVELLR
jgi:hypothetical protein